MGLHATVAAEELEVRGMARQLWAGGQGWGVYLSRLAAFAVLWSILTQGAGDSWTVGAPTVVLAALASAALLPPMQWSARGALRFWGFFLFESWRGGVDVAGRAFHRHLPLSPGLVVHRNRLSPAAARVAVANTVSLLPGTLSTDLDRDELQVHALDDGQEVRDSLQLAERRVAALFGLELELPELDRGPR